MAKKQDLVYEDKNVYEAALERIDKIYNSHDEMWISYSGGKDSLVCLKLMEEYLDSKGYNDKINVIFRDEEVISDAIRQFVLKDLDNPRYNMVYLATELYSEIYILGEKKKYIQWDNSRNWIVPKPERATTMKGVIKQEEFERHFFKDKSKRIALCTGIRASESLLRYQAITNSVIPYMTKSHHVKNVVLFKPIYDWEEKDVFKYFYDNDIEYCNVYDNQLFNKDPLRVASAIHAEAAKQLHKLKTNDPVLYNQIMDVWPEIDVQARYYKDLTKGSLIKTAYTYKEKAGDAWSAIYLYIKENINDPSMYQKAMYYVTMCKKIRDKKTTPADPLAGYPALHIFDAIIKGSYKRMIQPTSNRHQKYYDYEDISNRS